MVAILEQAKRLPPPRAAAGYEQAGLRLLATVCRELQRLRGPRAVLSGVPHGRAAVDSGSFNGIALAVAAGP